MTMFQRYKRGRWRSPTGWEIERRSRRLYVVIDPEGRLVHQAESLTDAVEWAVRKEGQAVP